MTNLPPADLQKKITAKRAAVTAAREAHAAAAAAHDAARERAAAAARELAASDPVDNYFAVKGNKIAAAEAEAARAARIKAGKLVTRREIALARLLDIDSAQREADQRARASEAAPVLKHDTATLAAAFKRAATAVFSDMEAAAARDTAARAARLEALEAPRRARFAAEAEARCALRAAQLDENKAAEELFEADCAASDRFATAEDSAAYAAALVKMDAASEARRKAQAAAVAAVAAHRNAAR